MPWHQGEAEIPVPAKRRSYLDDNLSMNQCRLAAELAGDRGMCINQEICTKNSCKVFSGLYCAQFTCEKDVPNDDLWLCAGQHRWTDLGSPNLCPAGSRLRQCVQRENQWGKYGPQGAGAAARWPA